MRTGKSQKLRHVRRTHGISISALHGWNKTGLFTLADCHTKAQAADVFTKGFVNPESWEHAVALIGMIDGATLNKICRSCPAVSSQGGALDTSPSGVVSGNPSKGGASTQRTNNVTNPKPAEPFKKPSGE